MSNEFVTESKKFIDNQITELKIYASSLKGSLSNRDLIISAIVKILKAKILERGDSGYTESSQDGLEAALNVLATQMYEDDSFNPTEESLGDASLALLGGLLAEESDSVFSFIREAASTAEESLATRDEMLESMKSRLVELNDLVAGIDSSWYDQKYISRLKSASSSLADADSDIQKIIYKANLGKVDLDRVENCSDSVNDAVLFLNDKKTLKSIGDISYIIDSIRTDLDEFENIGNTCDQLLDGLRSSKEEFIKWSNASTRMLSFYKNTMLSVNDSLDAVKIAIDRTIDNGIDAEAANNVAQWINQLVACRELLDGSIIKMDTNISDPANENTILLDAMIDGVSSVPIPINLDLPGEIKEAISLAALKIHKDIDIEPLTVKIDGINSDIDSDLVKSGEVTYYTNAYKPDPIDEARNFIALANELSQSNVEDLIMRSKWADIFMMGKEAVSIVGNLKGITKDLLTKITSETLKGKVLDIYFKIQAMHEVEALSSLTYDILKQSALDDVVNYKIPDLVSLGTELDELTDNLNKL